MPGTDCLVLLIEDSNIHMNLFILYDGEKESFFICGKKVAESEVEWVPYSFYCKDENVLMWFIDNVMDETVNISLYNFNSIPLSCDNLTFEILDNNSKNEACEIVNYMEHDNYYQNMVDYLKILKNIHNNFDT